VKIIFSIILAQTNNTIFYGGKQMKIKLLRILLAGVFVFGLFSLGHAAKPRRDGTFLGNGYPSGAHFNLNIKAKNDSFTCPDQADVMKYYCSDGDGTTYGTMDECTAALCTTDCIEVFGNVINFPQGDGSSNFTILMESGIEEPKGKPSKDVQPDYPDLLEVTDWCMGFENNDNAAFRLPADPDGYAVYARLVGDSKEDPEFAFTNPALDYVEDSNQDLLFLGYVNNGVFNPDGVLLNTVTKTKGNKLPKATDITPLFMWEGDVCTFENWYDVEATDQCCIDVLTYLDGDPDNTDPANILDEPDGIYEDCMDPADLCCIDDEPAGDPPGDGTYDDCVLPGTDPICPADYVFEAAACDVDYEHVDVFCIDYTDPVWVFNIAEFVGMLFDIDPVGPYKAALIKIRFYPLPLDIDNQPVLD